jgi:KDO2-lipid IV(A) lauroyltransferase
VRQLSESFPERSEAEIAELCGEYYHILAETFVGTMTLAGMSEQKKHEVLDVTVPEHIMKVVEGKHFVYLSSHHNFWEFAQFAGLKFTNHLTLCAYHPLTSKAWDELYYHLRYSKDALPVPSSQLIRYFLQHRKDGVDGRQLLLGLIADQNSPPKGEVHWYDFLHHKTLFFEGGEQMAVKFNLPVLYLSMSRVSAGKYRGEVILLYDGDESVEKHEITERYVRQLERDILREPAAWMWSHRRWKYHPDPVTGEPIYRRE